MSEKKYLDWQGLQYYHSKQKTEIQDLFGNVNSDITKINNNITNIDQNLSEIETNISNIQNTLDELDENDPLFVDSPAYNLTPESVNYLLEEYNNKPNYLIVNDVTRTQNDVAFVNVTYDNNNNKVNTTKYYLRSANNNLAGIITASDYQLLHSLNKTSAIGDENLLYNGQNINTNISGVGFSSTTNLLNNDYSIVLRSSSTNPFLGLKQGNNLWYAQASNNYFYFGPTSTKALRLDQNGNGLFTGSLTANQIIKSGGTNNQFLKADGSVDSNTYLTDSSLDDYYNKTEIDELLEDNIPTKTSDLTNDSGFITTADIPEGSAASTTVPLMDGTANVGSELAFARGDHRHPTDTTRQPLIDTNNKLSADLISNGTTNKVVTQSEKNVWNSKQGTISDLETIRSGASLGATALQSETDPTVPDYVKSITQADITNWNNKLSSAPVTSVNGQIGAVTIQENVKSNWATTDPTAGSFIINKPDVTEIKTLYYNDTTGLLATSSYSLTFTESLDGYDLVKCYFRATNKNLSDSNIIPPAILYIPLNEESQLLSGEYSGSVTIPYVDNDNRYAAYRCLISSDKTQFRVVSQTSLYGTVGTNISNANHGIYCYRIEAINTGNLIVNNTSSGGGTFVESDPVFLASPAYNITSTDISNWNNKLDSAPVISVNGMTGVVNLTIPSAVTESTVSGWGFTKNAGTVTGVKINNSTKNPTNGVVDLGTVLTSQTKANWNETNSNSAAYILNKPDLSTYENVITGITVNGESVTPDNKIVNINTTQLSSTYPESHSSEIAVSWDGLKFIKLIATFELQVNSILQGISTSDFRNYMNSGIIPIIEQTSQNSPFKREFYPCFVISSETEIIYESYDYSIRLNIASSTTNPVIMSVSSKTNYLYDGYNTVSQNFEINYDDEYNVISIDTSGQDPEILIGDSNIDLTINSPTYVQDLKTTNLNVYSELRLFNPSSSITEDAVIVSKNSDLKHKVSNNEYTIRDSGNFRKVMEYSNPTYSQELEYVENGIWIINFPTSVKETPYVINLPQSANIGDYLEVWVNIPTDSTINIQNCSSYSNNFSNISTRSGSYVKDSGIYIFTFKYLSGWNADVTIYT